MGYLYFYIFIAIFQIIFSGSDASENYLENLNNNSYSSKNLFSSSENESMDSLISKVSIEDDLPYFRSYKTNKGGVVLYMYNTQNSWECTKSAIYVSWDHGKKFKKVSLLYTTSPHIVDVHIVGDEIYALEARYRLIYKIHQTGYTYVYAGLKVLKMMAHPLGLNLILTLSLNKVGVTSLGYEHYKVYTSDVQSATWLYDKSGRFVVHTINTSSITYGNLYTFNAFFTSEAILLQKNVINYEVVASYIMVLIRNNTRNHLLYMPDTGELSRECKFPYNLNIYDFKIEHKFNKTLVIGIQENGQNGKYSLFVGSIDELMFVRIVDDLNYEIIPKTATGKKHICGDVIFVEKMPGVMLANIDTYIKNVGIVKQLMFSFDFGVRWHPPTINLEKIDSVDKDCISPHCNAYLNFGCGKKYKSSYTLLKNGNSPNVFSSTGYIQKSNEKMAAVFYSVDFGVTWTVVAKGRYSTAILNNGGLIAILPETSSQIMYTLNDGKDWKYESLGSSGTIDEILGVGFHPELNLMIFSKSNSYMSIYFANFSKLIKRSCVPSDYVKVLPYYGKQEHCFRGLKAYTYVKSQNSLCVNNLKNLPIINPEVCLCNDLDFGCFFGYHMVKGSCLHDPAYDPKHDNIDPKILKYCYPGEFITLPSTTARIAGDTCEPDGKVRGEKLAICRFDETHDFLVSLYGTRFKFGFDYSFSYAYGFYDLSFPIFGEDITSTSFAVDLNDRCIYYIKKNVGIKQYCWRTRAESVSTLHKTFLAQKDIKQVYYDPVGYVLIVLDSNGVKLYGVHSRFTKTIFKNTNDRKVSIFKAYTSGKLYLSFYGQKVIMVTNFKATEVVNVNTLCVPSSFAVSKDNLMYYSDGKTVYTLDINTKKSSTMTIKLDNPIINMEIFLNELVVASNNEMLYKKNHYKTLTDSFVVHNMLTKNPCENQTCEYFCALDNSGPHCYCPDNMVFDGKSCVCDSKNPHCLDCPVGHFKCKDLLCVPSYDRCDGVNDCPDGSDEMNCNYICNVEQFKCVKDATCIPLSMMCDGKKDCSDASDEQNCPIRKTCKSDEFLCYNQHCIPSKLKCNGINDCGDNSDEITCPDYHCSVNEFECHDKSCIPKSLVCNGEYDCLDFEDEADCKSYPIKPVNPECYIMCDDSKVCIKKDQFCNGITDCKDKTDELYCDHVQACKSGTQPCQLGIGCYDKIDECDHIEDCWDGTDEYKCKEVDYPCNMKYAFHCSKTKSVCISINQVCDGIKNCPDGSDEFTSTCDYNTSIIHSYVFEVKGKNSMQWYTNTRTKNQKFKVEIFSYENEKYKELMNTVVNTTKVSLPGLIPCEKYVYGISFEGTTKGMHSSSFKNSYIPLKQPKIIYINDTVTWEEVLYKCVPTAFYYECTSGSKTVLRGFTQKNKIPFNFSSNKPQSCAVAACYYKVYSLDCTFLSKINFESKTKTLLLVIFLLIVPITIITIFLCYRYRNKIIGYFERRKLHRFKLDDFSEEADEDFID